MKIISWNVNGLRAVYRDGFIDWVKKTEADVICLQEIKLQEGQVPTEVADLRGYNAYFSYAQKKGYSGLAVFTKEKPLRVENRSGFGRFDNEGRMLRLYYPGFTLINVYIPHGGRGKENLPYKLEAYKHLLQYLAKVKDEKAVVVGDFNVAHEDVDLARPNQNKNNIMFTPPEREQLDKIADLGFVDSFRKLHREGGNYTWWPYFANARARNLGWRIDYAFVSRKLSPRLKKAFILKDTKGSDHCPVGIEV
ncbi:exodeoxyribonuclease III [Patescibacteria group bacterium]|nr:exodeoxyribonuclease III [Patescibacteria group bacterium]